MTKRLIAAKNRVRAQKEEASRKEAKVPEKKQLVLVKNEEIRQQMFFSMLASRFAYLILAASYIYREKEVTTERGLFLFSVLGLGVDFLHFRYNNSKISKYVHLAYKTSSLFVHVISQYLYIVYIAALNFAWVLQEYFDTDIDDLKSCMRSRKGNDLPRVMFIDLPSVMLMDLPSVMFMVQLISQFAKSQFLIASNEARYDLSVAEKKGLSDDSFSKILGPLLEVTVLTDRVAKNPVGFFGCNLGYSFIILMALSVPTLFLLPICESIIYVVMIGIIEMEQRNLINAKMKSDLAPDEFLKDFNDKADKFAIKLNFFDESVIKGQLTSQVVNKPGFNFKNIKLCFVKIYAKASGCALNSGIILSCDEVGEAVKMAFSDVGLSTFLYIDKSSQTKRDKSIGLAYFETLANFNTSILEQLISNIEEKYALISVRKQTLERFPLLGLENTEFSFVLNPEKNAWIFSIDFAAPLSRDSGQFQRFEKALKNFNLSDDGLQVTFSGIIPQNTHEMNMLNKVFDEYVSKPNAASQSGFFPEPVVSKPVRGEPRTAYLGRDDHPGSSKDEEMLPDAIVTNKGSIQYVWKNLFGGKPIDPNHLPSKYLVQFDRNSCFSEVSGPIVCWDEDQLCSESAQVGDDIHKLKKVFDRQSKDGLSFLKNVCLNGNEYKIYELRLAKRCDSRIICVSLNEGNTPLFLYAVEVRNHARLDKPMAPAINAALRLSEKYTTRLYQAFFESKSSSSDSSAAPSGTTSESALTLGHR